MSTKAVETKDKGTTSNGKAGKPFSKRGSDQITRSLNQLLANYSVHYQKLRNFHWNVKGSDFFDLHEEFEKQYDEARQNLDTIAEQIRVFGHTPYSTMKEYLEQSEIKESSPDLSSDEMVKEILKDYRILLGYMDDAVEVAMENSDGGSEEMVKGFIKKIEKHHWMLSAFAAE